MLIFPLYSPPYLHRACVTVFTGYDAPLRRSCDIICLLCLSIFSTLEKASGHVVVVVVVVSRAGWWEVLTKALPVSSLVSLSYTRINGFLSLLL